MEAVEFIRTIQKMCEGTDCIDCVADTHWLSEIEE